MKIKCKDCVNETMGRCSIKKTTVKLNKSRKCNDYSFDQYKEIARLEQKARSMDAQDRAYQAKRAHPLTGDLGRFKTTATK